MGGRDRPVPGSSGEGSGQEVCSSFISVAVMKCPDKDNLERNGFILAHNFRSRAIPEGKSHQEEVEGTGHITATVKSRERWTQPCSHSCLIVLNLMPLLTCLGNGAAHSGPGLPILVDIIKTTSCCRAPNMDNPSPRLFPGDSS